MPRILIIEDERPLRTALTDLLESEGHRVITAVEGERGLARALEEQPDLILLDVMMPRLDGFALAAELRRLGRSTPILMLTAKGQVEDRERALLRRHSGARVPALECLRLGAVEIVFVRMQARQPSGALHLTSKEFAMLRLLAEAAGEPMPSGQWSRQHCFGWRSLNVVRAAPTRPWHSTSV